jgi:hypothetical protein
MISNFLNSKIVLILTSFVLIFNVFFVSSALAGNGADTVLWAGQAPDVQTHTGLGNNDPRIITANLINIILGFLGILSLLLILFGGFKWMTAAGNDDQVASAKKLLVAAVIGLVIILSAYALAAFVLDAIFRTTT